MVWVAPSPLLVSSRRVLHPPPRFTKLLNLLQTGLITSPCSWPRASCPSFLGAGSFGKFLNLQISLIIAMQLSMCLFLSVASLIWVDNVGVDHYYLALTTFTQVGWVHTPLPGTGGS